MADFNLKNVCLGMEETQLGPTREVPETYGLVCRARNQVSTVMGYCNRVHLKRMGIW